MFESPYGSPPLSGVKITGGFFADYQRIMKNDAIPYQWSVLNDELAGVEKSGAIENFRIAAGESTKAYYGTCFQDSDVGKWLEGVAYLLCWAPNKALEQRADEVIDLLGRAQREDGYLNTYFTVAEPGGRFQNIRECDELYCFGHLAEAAAAYWQATGKRRFLEIICRYADLLCATFGRGEGQIPACDGHPEAELAFVRLYEVTGNQKYLEQAAFQLDVRGSEPYYYDLEWERRGRKSFHPHLQGEKPSDDKGYDQSERAPRHLREPVGHAVKLCYLLAGMAAYCSHTDDREMFEACRNVFDSIRNQQMYLTGAVGATRHKEAFTKPYHLPNDRAYGETCASAALVFAMRRMLLNEPDAAFADVMERVLYNALPAGVSFDGRGFFYVNPLEVYPRDIEADADYQAVKPVRQPWFACACCPPNLVRLLTGLGAYLYTHSSRTLYVHLFADSAASVRLSDALCVQIRQTTDYPWDGAIHFEIQSTGAFRLAIRIPGWCENASLLQDHAPIALSGRMNRGYALLDCPPGKTDVELSLDMPPCFVEANPAVKADAGKVAVMRGPVVYCAEECDNGPRLFQLAVHPGAAIEICRRRLRGAPMLEIAGGLREGDDAFQGLYRRYAPSGRQTPIRLIPYGMWGNRRRSSEPEEMTVWLRRAIAAR